MFWYYTKALLPFFYFRKRVNDTCSFLQSFPSAHHCARVCTLATCPCKCFCPGGYTEHSNQQLLRIQSSYIVGHDSLAFLPRRQDNTFQPFQKGHGHNAWKLHEFLRGRLRLQSAIAKTQPYGWSPPPPPHRDSPPPPPRPASLYYTSSSSRAQWPSDTAPSRKPDVFIPESDNLRNSSSSQRNGFLRYDDQGDVTHTLTVPFRSAFFASHIRLLRALLHYTAMLSLQATALPVQQYPGLPFYKKWQNQLHQAAACS